MNRHLASKKTKRILTGYDIVNIPIPISLGWIMLVLGIFKNFYGSYIWISHIYVGILMSGLVWFASLSLLKKGLKPNREFAGILGVNILWALGCGWWMITWGWLLLNVWVLLLMFYPKK